MLRVLPGHTRALHPSHDDDAADRGSDRARIPVVLGDEVVCDEGVLAAEEPVESLSQPELGLGGRVVSEDYPGKRALPNIAAWRAESVTAAAVASACEAAGLCVIRQELINWADTVCLVDCLTTITRRASAHARAPAELVSNPRFMDEAVRPEPSSES